MKRKASFSPKSPKPNSSDHNLRKEMPKYLIEEDPNFDGNYYEQITPYIDDQQLTKLAKKIYNQKFIERTGQNQRMQKLQEKSLIKEVVISTEEDHRKEDILSLFDMLRREKAEDNYLKEDMAISRLNPVPVVREFKLPKKLKIKRKAKKENLHEAGYHILELAGHYDEGHFIRKGKWDGLSYYPARDIMLKEDGKWYIKSNELSEDKSDKMFDVLVDMSEFEKVYNYHWHVKFTHFNVETGLAARFSKGEISGEGRLKKVAEHLGLRYVPEEKIPLEQGVKSIKEQHHRDRQNKYRQLMMKFQHQVEIANAEDKVVKREDLLVDRVDEINDLKKLYNQLPIQLKELEIDEKILISIVKDKVGLISGYEKHIDNVTKEVECLKGLLEEATTINLLTQNKISTLEQKIEKRTNNKKKTAKAIKKIIRESDNTCIELENQAYTLKYNDEGQHEAILWSDKYNEMVNRPLETITEIKEVLNPLNVKMQEQINALGKNKKKTAKAIRKIFRKNDNEIKKLNKWVEFAILVFEKFANYFKIPMRDTLEELDKMIDAKINLEKWREKEANSNIIENVDQFNAEGEALIDEVEELENKVKKKLEPKALVEFLEVLVKENEMLLFGDKDGKGQLYRGRYFGYESKKYSSLKKELEFAKMTLMNKGPTGVDMDSFIGVTFKP